MAKTNKTPELPVAPPLCPAELPEIESYTMVKRGKGFAVLKLTTQGLKVISVDCLTEAEAPRQEAENKLRRVFAEEYLFGWAFGEKRFR